MPVRPKEQQQLDGGADGGGGDEGAECVGDDECAGGVGDLGAEIRTNMHGINYVMWFDVSIEGKDSMDPQEEDWGGRLEFGFDKKGFSVDLEDYFLLFEDECSIQSHA